jgi:tellurite resistance protein TerC
MSALWIGVALAFNAFVYFWLGGTAALEFFTGWLLEKSLSVDNLFVFVVIFSYFKVEPQSQRRVLVWGIIGGLWCGCGLLGSGLDIGGFLLLRRGLLGGALGLGLAQRTL